MADDFFDTSALVKAYVPEVGPAWVRSLLDPRCQPRHFHRASHVRRNHIGDRAT